jgi:hypothetical protein
MSLMRFEPGLSRITARIVELEPVETANGLLATYCFVKWFRPLRHVGGAEV